jgi:hypothetical protein
MKHRPHLLVGAFWTSCFSGLQGDLRIGLAGLVGWRSGGIKKMERKRKKIYTSHKTRTLKFEHIIVWRVEFFNADGSGNTTDKGSAIAQTESEKKLILTCKGTTNQHSWLGA